MKNYKFYLENNMEILAELAKLIIPAAIVLYGMYLTVKSFTNKELERSLVDLKMKNRDIILPIRLQAYERICLFLERISPNNLVMRLNDSAYNAKQFQHILLSEIRNEYNHNLSQQVYMTDNAWKLVVNVKEEIIAVINQAGHALPEDAKSLDLAKIIFKMMSEKEIDPVTMVLSEIKNEIRLVF